MESNAIPTTATGVDVRTRDRIVVARTAAEAEGTGLSAASRNRTTAAPMAAAKVTALLPISDVVVFDGLAGIRSWSPPV